MQQQLGLPIAFTAPLGKVTDAFTRAMRQFVVDEGVPWVDFVKRQRKGRDPARTPSPPKATRPGRPQLLNLIEDVVNVPLVRASGQFACPSACPSQGARSGGDPRAAIA